MNLSPGDKNYYHPITFAASANCIRYCGASNICRYCPDTYLIDLNQVKKELARDIENKIKGIILLTLQEELII